MRILDEVHIVGMSESGSTYMSVTQVCDSEGKVVRVEPPIRVVLEGEDARVAVTQDALAARYDNEELSQIGDGNPILGLKRVIGSIATSGGLEVGAIKPLHPSLFEAEVVDQVAELVTSTPQLTA